MDVPPTPTTFATTLAAPSVFAQLQPASGALPVPSPQQPALPRTPAAAFAPPAAETSSEPAAAPP
eukprot:917248-Prymnesium_polylepis.1